LIFPLHATDGHCLIRLGGPIPINYNNAAPTKGYFNRLVVVLIADCVSWGYEGILRSKMKLAQVHYRNKHIEPVWHVQLAVLAAILLQVVINHDLTVGPKYVIAGLEVLLLFSLAVLKPTVRLLRHSLAVALIAVVSVANITSLVLVVHSLFIGSAISGKDLIISGLVIYLTNIIIFGLWYWELDSNGVQGQSTTVPPIDFLFPQMTPGEHALKPGVWSPTFFDYLYVSVTNASSFSPSDTPPLTHRAKSLMAMQSLVSLVTVALVAARAINIIG
jgi:hypothetical protein